MKFKAIEEDENGRVVAVYLDEVGKPDGNRFVVPDELKVSQSAILQVDATLKNGSLVFTGTIPEAPLPDPASKPIDQTAVFEKSP